MRHSAENWLELFDIECSTPGDWMPPRAMKPEGTVLGYRVKTIRAGEQIEVMAYPIWSTAPMLPDGAPMKKSAAAIARANAEALKQINPARMYFAYDTPDDYDPLVEAGKILRVAGHKVSSHTMGCYVLIGYPRDTFEHAERRLIDTIKAGFMPYAMLYRGDDGYRDSQWMRFQREWLRPAIVGIKMREYWGAPTSAESEGTE